LVSSAGLFSSFPLFGSSLKLQALLLKLFEVEGRCVEDPWWLCSHTTFGFESNGSNEILHYIICPQMFTIMCVFQKVNAQWVNGLCTHRTRKVCHQLMGEQWKIVNNWTISDHPFLGLNMKEGKFNESSNAFSSGMLMHMFQERVLYLLKLLTHKFYKNLERQPWVGWVRRHKLPISLKREIIVAYMGQGLKKEKTLDQQKSILI